MAGEKKYANDPIPENAIRLGEAFDEVLHAINQDRTPLDKLNSELKDYLIKNRQQEEQRDRWRSKTTKSKESHHRIKEAVVFFRSNLSRGELTACVRDPQDGTVLQLDAADWSPVGGRLLLLEPPYAFEDNFLENAPFSGNPDTFIHGAYRPVFIRREEFKLWFNKTFGRQKRGGGRPPGAGSLEDADRPFLERMRELRKSGEAKSDYEAACKVEPDVPRRNAKERR